MRTRGSRSWSLTSNVGQLPQAALWIRDAARLPVPPHPAVPPALLDSTPLWSMLPDRDSLARAAYQWSAWWHSVVAVVAAERDPRQASIDVATERQLISAYCSVVDPPNFDSAPGPELQGILRERFHEARRWADTIRREWVPPSRYLVDWRVAKRTAERVASDHSVSPQRVRAHVEVVLVKDRWSYRPSPGVLVCSPAVVDGADFEVLLYQTFKQTLSGP